jgi:hypothetical protein
MKRSTFTTISTTARLLPYCLAATALMANMPLGALAYTAVFTLSGQGNSGNNSLVNSRTFTNNGVTLTIDGLNGGGFRVSDLLGLCAYWSQNNGISSGCNNDAMTGYNGLNFTIGANSKPYNVKLDSIVLAVGRFGSGNIQSTFTGASGSSATFAPDSFAGNTVYDFNNTPILANSQNQISLCSTPNITNTVTLTSYACSGNISNSSN